jgi:ABC-type antimicrobial peptide transport system permease subunit
LTSAYHKTFYGEENLAQSGTGGYQLWAETSIPVPFDLNTFPGKEKLIVENSSDLDSVHFIQFHSIDGDDASCLNLNKVRRPRILGIPAEVFDRKKSFSFVNYGIGINRDHPWKNLNPKPGADIYCAFADQTVIQYGLQKSMNDTLRYLNEAGKSFNLRIAAGMDNSIFQGNLLISDSVLLSQYPSSPGSSIMLVEVPASKVQVISSILKTSLKDFGIEISSTSSRLAEFNSVENTYLSVFLALGGLGLIMGTFGLGILLFRNILERKHELALLQALGFSKNKISRLIILEYGFLLISGMICGILSAFIAVFPSLISPAFHMQMSFVGILILLIFLSGSLWIIIPSHNILKSSLIPSLKND